MVGPIVKLLILGRIGSYQLAVFIWLNRHTYVPLLRLNILVDFEIVEPLVVVVLDVSSIGVVLTSCPCLPLDLIHILNEQLGVIHLDWRRSTLVRVLQVRKKHFVLLDSIELLSLLRPLLDDWSLIDLI